MERRRKCTISNAAVPQRGQGRAETCTRHTQNIIDRGILKFFCGIPKCGMEKMYHFSRTVGTLWLGLFEQKLGKSTTGSWGRKVSTACVDRVTSEAQVQLGKKIPPVKSLSKMRDPSPMLTWLQISQLCFLQLSLLYVYFFSKGFTMFRKHWVRKKEG